MKKPYKYLKNSSERASHASPLQIVWAMILRRKILIISTFVILFFLPIAYLTTRYQSKTEAAWMDDQWGYRQTVAITNAGAAQTDFQVSITLNTSTLVTAGKMQSDCDDIRITDVSGKVLLHWIQTGTNVCNSTTTIIWTKVPLIPTSGATVYIYYGNPSATSASNISWMPTGGTITSISGYRIHTFTSSETFTATANVNVETLVVGGGGGGGMDMGGGGGGGGVIYNSSYAVTPQSYSVTVGLGGSGAPAAGTNGQPGGHQYTIPATNGQNSIFGTLTAIGGGFGGSSYRGYTPGIAGGNGGSGGGASGYNDNAGTFYGGTGTSGQGNRGGNSTAAYYSGGGGGAGAAGADSTNQPNGGVGVESAINGTSYYWGGGGGGSSYSLSTGGNGGNGGGGGGAIGVTTGGTGLNAGSPGGGGSPNSWANMPGGNGGANTGGGGGGGSHYNANNKGGDGGSGIVVIRYPSATGPAVASPTNEEKSAGPVAYWKFDEGQGVTAQNSTWQKTGTTINLMSDNPSLDAGTLGSTPTGWTQDNCVSLVLSADRSVFGAYSGKAVCSGAQSVYSSGRFSLTRNTQYTASAWIYSSVQQYITVEINNLVTGGFSGGTTIAANSWTRVTATGSTLDDANNSYVLVIRNAVASTIYIDGTQVEQSSLPTSYCDGSVTGNGSHVWNGTAHASTSTCNTGTDGEINGATWQTEDQCVSGKCLRYDGSNDYVGIGNTIDFAYSQFSSGYTVSLWVKPSAIPSSKKALFSSAYGTSGDQWQTYVWYDTNGTFGTAQRYSSSQNDFSGNVHAANTWYHVTVTWDGSFTRLYVNGSYENSAAGSQPTNQSSSMEVRIGTFKGYSNTEFNGFIDDVKIYPYARTAAQIKSDFASKGSGSVKGTAASLGSSAKNSDAFSNGLVGYWKMDEASWNGTAGEVVDASGNGNNGTAVNGATTASGKFGNSGSFTNTSSHKVSVSSPSNIPSGNGAYTISAWIKPTSYGTYGIIGWGTFGSGNAVNAFRLTGDGLVNYWWSNDLSVTKSGLTDGNWHHVVALFDGTTRSIYVDGARIGSDTPTGHNVVLSNFNIATTNTSEYFPGKIDEVRIYNRALSPKEVRQLYAWAPGPVAYYNFEEGSGTSSVNDSSGNGNTATMNGLTSSDWVSGKFGKGLQFNNSDYLNVSVNSWIRQAENVTVSGWYYHTGDTTGAPWGIMTGTGAGSDDGFWWHIKYSGGPLYLRTEDNVHGESDGTGTAFVTAGNWYYLTTIVGANKFDVYVNGVLYWSWTPNSSFDWPSINSDTANLYIGKSYISDNSVNGKIDEVKIYNYARSSKQIVEDMNGGHPAGGSPVGSQVGYWKFDEGYGNTLNNSGSGTANGSNSNATWTNNGKFNKALSFNGSSAIVTIPLAAGSTAPTELTISAWAKRTRTGATEYIVDSDGDESTIMINSSDKVLCEYYTGTAILNVTSIQSITDTNWHQISCVFNYGNFIKLYIDGKNDNSNNSPSGALGGGILSNTWVGARGNPLYYFSGSIDEVKIYRAALTEDEIKLDYNHGSAMVLGESVENRDRVTSGQTLYLDATDKTSYPGTGTAWYDRSGNGYNATLSSPTWNGLKFTNTAATLTGLGTSIYPNIATNTTILWVYPETGGGSAWLVTPQDIHTYMSYSGDSSAYINTWDNGSSQRTIWNVTECVPHQFVFTKNGSVRTTYDNLVQKGQVTLTDPAPSVNSNIVYGSAGLPMGLSIVETYNRVLSMDEITQDYYAHAYKFNINAEPVGEWKFDEKTGANAYDTSGNGNTGTLTNGPTWKSAGECKVGACLNFSSGSSQYVDGGVNSSLDLGAGSGTIEAWFKTSANGAIVTKRVNSGFQVYVWGNKFYADGAGTAGVYSANNVTDGAWHHGAAVYDRSGSLLRLYVDGKADNTVALGSTTLTDAANLNIGRKLLSGAGDYFNGSIDQVRIFNYARTPAQIAYDYNRGAPVGHWKMDECQGGTANDSSGNGNVGTITIGGTGTQTAVGTCTTSGTAWYNGVTGKYNSSLNFDGTDDYVVISSPSRGSLNPEYLTVGAWVKPSAAQFGQIVSKNGPYALYMNTDRTITFNIYAGSTPAWSGITTTDTIPLSSWSHVSGTYDGTTMKIYINGTLSKTGAHSQGGVAYATGANVYIGYGNPGFNQYFSGQIDDVRVYNYALTPLQIKTLYNGGSTIRFGPSTGSP